MSQSERYNKGKRKEGREGIKKTKRENKDSRMEYMKRRIQERRELERREEKNKEERKETRTEEKQET
jgi:hypothetical protein